MSVETTIYEQFFQRNSAYYLEKLQLLRQGKKFSFNFFAFLFGFFWFLYRKMYLESLVIAFILVLQSIAEVYIFEELFGDRSVLYHWLVTFLIWTIIGFTANFLYLRKAERIVSRAFADNKDPELAQQYVLKKGGTSYLFLIIFVLVIAAFAIYLNLQADI